MAIAIDRRALEESKLNDAQSFVSGEIARAEYELAFIKKEIDQLNDTVGIEVKRLEDESHAREIMARNRELSPLLIAVNVTFREIKAMDSDLEEIHSEKHALKEKILQKKEELKVSYGANEAIQYSKIMSELNDRMIELDEAEELLIKRKEAKIEEFKQAKRKAHEFLDSSSYELNDIIAVEDKVVGDLEFERVKSEYESKRYEAQVKRSFAQKRYDTLLKRKVKNTKRNSANYQAYIDELDQISTELKQANAEFEKANSDCEKVLPSISAISLVRSGSGVISRERLARKQEELRKERTVKAEKPAPIQEEVEEKPVEKVEQPQQERRYEERREFAQPRESRPQGRTPNYPVSAQPTAIQIRKLMARLNELERIALQEKEQRVAMRRERVRAADETNKIDRRRAQIVELRKQLDYIATENEVWKFKERLRRIVDSFDADEASDEVLNKMVQRLMNDATRLGERLSGRNGGANGNRRR